MTDIRSIKASKILYSRSSIKNRNTEYGFIGEQLDKYYDGRLDVNRLPRLQVFRQEDKWMVSNTDHMNQLLWIMQNLERLNKCHVITVEIVTAPEEQVVAYKTVDITGGPRGQYHKKIPHKALKLNVQTFK